MKHNAPPSDPSRSGILNGAHSARPPNKTRINQIPARQQPAGGWQWASDPRQQSQSARNQCEQPVRRPQKEKRRPGSSAGEGWPTADLWRPLLVSRRPTDFTPSSSGGRLKRNGSLIHQVTAPRFPGSTPRASCCPQSSLLPLFSPSTAISIASNHPFASSW